MTPLPRFVPVSHPGALSGRVPKGGGRVVTGPAGGQAGFADRWGPAASQVVSGVLSAAGWEEARLTPGLLIPWGQVPPS